jgi:hypothetical protein
MKRFNGCLLVAAVMLAHCAAGLAAQPAVLNAKGQLLLDGRPLFPVGIYEVPIPEIPSVSKESFNVIVNPYWAQGPQSTPEYLKAARASGFSLIAGFPYEKVRARDGKYIEEYVRAVKDDDQLLTWYLFEEPAGSRIKVDEGEAALKMVRKQDPARPILFVDFDLKHIEEYKNCYDIFAYDYYPVGTGSMVYWRNLVNRVMKAVRPKPVWLVIQAFGYDDQKKDWTLPTPQEMRCMTYLAVIQGAQGILFYAHARKGDSFYVRDHPEHWACLQQLAAELLTLSPVLLAPAVDDRVSVENKSLDVTLRRRAAPSNAAQTELYLIAANLAHTAPALNRHFPGVRQSAVRIALTDMDQGRAELVGTAGAGSAKAGRSLPIQGGTFTDAFDPYAVHIYKISTTGPGGPSSIR